MAKTKSKATLNEPKTEFPSTANSDSVELRSSTVSPKSTKPRIRIRREGDSVIVSVPVKFYRRNGRQMVLAESNEHELTTELLVEANSALFAAIARAYQWQEQLESGEFASLEDLAKDFGVNRGYVSRILQLTSLSPTIIDQILSGQNSTQLTIRQLRRGITAVWSDQRYSK
jgi:AraC-like DNA-binding protein